MLKKCLSVVLSALLLVSAVACTGGGVTSDESQPVSAAATLPGTEAPGEVPTDAATQPKTDAETQPATDPETETETDAETEVEDMDMGGDFITGPKSLERLLGEFSLTELTVNSTPNVQLLDAFGTEWDPHFFRYYNQESGCDEEAWAMIVRRIQTIGLQKVRMMVLPGWYESHNDDDDPHSTDLSNFSFDSEPMYSLLRSLDVCEQNGIKVNLTIWGVNLGVEPTMAWLAYPDCGGWISAPTDKEEFAENVSALLSFLLNQKKYTCVRELTLYNEPDWAYKGAGGRVSFEDYATLCRTVNDRLIADGLRDKIKLILCDDTDTLGNASVPEGGWFSLCLNQLTDIADGFDTHFYAFNNNSNPRSAQSWARVRNKYFQKYAAGLQYTHNEFGTNLQQGAYYQTDIDTYERGLFVAKMATATLNEGSAGMLYWVLHDERYNNYANRADSVMQLGLFGYADEGWKVRPVYHAWGLIMSHTVPGSAVYSISLQGYISAVALKTPEGDWTYIVNNAGKTGQVVQITNPGGVPAAPNVYLYAVDTVTTDDTLIPSAGLAYTCGTATYLYLPPNSFAVVGQ